MILFSGLLYYANIEICLLTFIFQFILFYVGRSYAFNNINIIKISKTILKY